MPAKGEGKPDETAKKEQLEREKERLQQKEATIRKLEVAILDLDDKSRKYRAMMQELAIPRNGDFDEKVLAEAITALDRAQLAVEEDPGTQEAKQRKLKELGARRQELVLRLRHQQLERSQQTRDIEHLERALSRCEKQADELHDYLFRLRFDLGPRQSAVSTEQTLGQLLREVADLKKEVRKLAEEKK